MVEGDSSNHIFGKKTGSEPHPFITITKQIISSLAHGLYPDSSSYPEKTENR